MFFLSIVALPNSRQFDSKNTYFRKVEEFSARPLMKVFMLRHEVGMTLYTPATIRKHSVYVGERFAAPPVNVVFVRWSGKLSKCKTRTPWVKAALRIIVSTCRA